jgi:hypothetical protein
VRQSLFTPETARAIIEAWRTGEHGARRDHVVTRPEDRRAAIAIAICVAIAVWIILSWQ